LQLGGPNGAPERPALAIGPDPMAQVGQRAGWAVGYDDLRVLEARTFLAAVRDGVQGEPGIAEMLACARVLDAIERSAQSLAWEAAA